MADESLGFADWESKQAGRASWQCPGCREYKAPHVDSCGCAADAVPIGVSPQGDAFDRAIRAVGGITRPPKGWEPYVDPEGFVRGTLVDIEQGCVNPIDRPRKVTTTGTASAEYYYVTAPR